MLIEMHEAFVDEYKREKDGEFAAIFAFAAMIAIAIVVLL